jgi:hypothetical protein
VLTAEDEVCDGKSQMGTEFWNIIHDGRIEAIAGQVPGNIVLTIGLEYLCKHLPAEGDTLHATLRDCQLLAYTPFDGSTVTDLQRIAELKVEVLSAVAQVDGVSVCCVNGRLDAAYASVEVRTVDGKLVSQADLEAAGNRSVAACVERSCADQAAG